MSQVERTFLLKTSIECPCWTIEVASNCNCLENEFRPCGGKTDNRPSWCPLVELCDEMVADIKENLEAVY